MAYNFFTTKINDRSTKKKIEQAPNLKHQNK
jgi:hypothetical protein